MSFPFFSLTAMKLTVHRNCMNLEAEDLESICSNGFTFVLKMGIINACSCWTISTFFILMISMGGFYWFTLHMMGVGLFTLLEIAESFNEQGLIIFLWKYVGSYHFRARLVLLHFLTLLVQEICHCAHVWWDTIYRENWPLFGGGGTAPSILG